MKVALKAVLFFTLSLLISCSNGGSDSTSSPTPAPTKAAGPATDPNTIPSGEPGQKIVPINQSLIGTWEGNGINLVITANSIELSAKCQSGEQLYVKSGITATQTTLTILEDQVSGKGECSISLKKSQIVNFSINGDNLEIGVDKEMLVFTRVRK